ATRALRNGREAAAAALQAELAEYRQTETASSIDSASETAPAPEPQAPSPEMVAQQESLAKQQRVLANQAAALQLSQEQSAPVARNQQLDHWIATTPEATSWPALEHTLANSPERAAWVTRGDEQILRAQTSRHEKPFARGNGLDRSAQAAHLEGD